VLEFVLEFDDKERILVGGGGISICDSEEHE